MYFMLDNYDSFVYNLSASFKELGQDILVKREHEITLSEIEALRPEGIILSPGPGKPSDAAMSLRILETFTCSGCVSGASGHRILFRRLCKEGEKAHAREAYGYRP